MHFGFLICKLAWASQPEASPSEALVKHFANTRDRIKIRSFVVVIK